MELSNYEITLKSIKIIFCPVGHVMLRIITIVIMQEKEGNKEESFGGFS